MEYLACLVDVLCPSSTQAAEEAITLFGEPGALRTAWRVQENLTELSYTQLWALIGENQVEKVRWVVRQSAAAGPQQGQLPFCPAAGQCWAVAVQETVPHTCQPLKAVSKPMRTVHLSQGSVVPARA
jgi:hypothetical protein